MQFRLEKESATKALAKFRILNSAGEMVGVVNIPPSQEADLLKHWNAPQEAAQANSAAAKAARGKAAIVAALRKGPKLSKAALLRS